MEVRANKSFAMAKDKHGNPPSHTNVQLNNHIEKRHNTSFTHNRSAIDYIQILDISPELQGNISGQESRMSIKMIQS